MERSLPLRRRRVALLSFTAVVTMLASVGIGVSHPVGAQAATNCGSQTIGNYFAGYHNYNVANLVGISDSLYVRDGALCIGAPSGSYYSGWSMVTGHNGIGYAQSGFDHTLGGGNPTYDRDFAQSNTCNSCFPDSNFTTHQVHPGTAYSYYTDIEGPQDDFYMYDTFTRLLISSFSADVLPYPYGYALEGEVSDLGDDTPGLANSSMGHTHLRWLNGTTWSQAMPTPTRDDQNPYRWTTNPTTNSFTTCVDGYECGSSWTFYQG